METKERILNTALAIYNEKGVGTTTRHIAAEMGISPGNLHYHFKQTEDVITALWERLVGRMDTMVQELRTSEINSITTLHSFFGLSFQIIYEYRFIFLHFVELANRIPAIRKEYHILIKRREKEFKDIFQKLVTNKVFKVEIRDKDLPLFVKQVFIVADFWLSNNELTDRLKGRKAEEAFLRQMDALFSPYYR
jgi:AcrR family transcriptional regulator